MKNSLEARRLLAILSEGVGGIGGQDGQCSGGQKQLLFYSFNLEFERQNAFVNVIVDEPPGIANTIPSVCEVTNQSLAVVRLHGRNHGMWNKKGLKASSSRFDYDYDESELREIAGQVKELAPKAKQVHILFNNNYQDQGQRGAATLA